MHVQQAGLEDSSIDWSGFSALADLASAMSVPSATASAVPANYAEPAHTLPLQPSDALAMNLLRDEFAMPSSSWTADSFFEWSSDDLSSDALLPGNQLDSAELQDFMASILNATPADSPRPDMLVTGQQTSESYPPLQIRNVSALYDDIRRIWPTIADENMFTTAHNTDMQLALPLELEVVHVVHAELAQNPALAHMPEFSSQLLGATLDSFWRQVHPRMPVLHRATFCISQRHPLLLLAMCAAGAMRMGSSGVSAQFAHSAFVRIWSTIARRWEVASTAVPATTRDLNTRFNLSELPLTSAQA